MKSRQVVLIAALIVSVMIFFINQNRMMETKRAEAKAVKVSHIQDRISTIEIELSYERTRLKMLEETYSEYRGCNDADEIKECKSRIEGLVRELRHYQDKIYELD